MLLSFRIKLSKLYFSDHSRSKPLFPFCTWHCSGGFCNWDLFASSRLVSLSPYPDSVVRINFPFLKKSTCLFRFYSFVLLNKGYQPHIQSWHGAFECLETLLSSLLWEGAQWRMAWALSPWESLYFLTAQQGSDLFLPW